MKWSKSNADAGAKESQSEPKDEPPKQESGQGQEEDEAQYPSLKVVVPILLSICLAVFLTALVSVSCFGSSIDRSWPNHNVQDRTIIGVAVPAISNEFNSFDDISWYESAYLLTFCAFQLPIGKAYVCLSPSAVTPCY